MADETQPLIEQERTYDPTADASLDTEEAFDVYTQYVKDLLERESVDVVRLADADKCEICVKLTECTETRILPTLLKMKKVNLFSMYMATSPPTSNTIFTIEDGFKVPDSYQPARPDVEYINSLFRPKETAEFNDGVCKMRPICTPTQSSLRELEKSDNYRLDSIDYDGSGEYLVTVKWLGGDTES